jgi:hypothetical protein
VQLVPVSPDQFRGKAWKALLDFRFAAEDTSVLLQAAEMPKACVAFPIAFIPHEDGYAPAGILGITLKENLLVGPEGQWLGVYLPAAYAQYPFFLAKDQHGKKVLAYDAEVPVHLEESTAEPLEPSAQEKKPFFDATGKPSAAVMEVLNRFAQMDADKTATQTACDLLEVHKLLEPWPLTIKMGESERKLDGLFRVNAAKLEALKTRPLAALHKEGALAAAFCQLISMQQLRVLGQLFQQRRAGAVLPGITTSQHTSAEIDFSFLNDN